MTYGLCRHVGVVQGGAQTRFGLTLGLRDGLNIGQQCRRFVFCLRLVARRQVVDTNDAALELIEAKHDTQAAPSRCLLGNTCSALQNAHSHVTYFLTTRGPRYQGKPNAKSVRLRLEKYHSESVSMSSSAAPPLWLQSEDTAQGTLAIQQPMPFKCAEAATAPSTRFRSVP